MIILKQGEEDYMRSEVSYGNKEIIWDQKACMGAEGLCWVMGLVWDQEDYLEEGGL